MAAAPVDGPAPASARRHGVIAAAATALALAVPGGDPPGPDGGGRWLVLVGALAAGAALLVLLRRPVLAVLACLAVCAGTQLLTGGPTGVVVVVLVALHLAAVRSPVRVAVELLGICCVGYLAAELATGGYDSRVLAPLALMAASTAAGVAVAKQRALVRAATERAAAAERTRQEEAARQVADERLRIARELHDVVAHHVAVMGVQAGAAAQLLDTDRDRAHAALAQVRASGRTALTELGAVVGLLRTRSEGTGGARTDGVPPVAAGLDRLPELLASVRDAGLRLTASLPAAPPGGTWVPADLDEVAGMTVYRVVQESLTNALRHGTGEAGLTVAVSPAAVAVEVVNPVAAPAAPAAAGHGLLGMRERAALAGGELHAAPTGDGHFAVRARIPVRRPVRA